MARWRSSCTGAIVVLLVVQVTLGKIATRTAGRTRATGDDGPAQVRRHHDTGSCAGPPRLALDRPPPAAPADAALAGDRRATEPLGAVRAAVRPAALRLADVVGREPPGELVRPRAAPGLHRTGPGTEGIARERARDAGERAVRAGWPARRGGTQAPVPRPRRAPVAHAAVDARNDPARGAARSRAVLDRARRAAPGRCVLRDARVLGDAGGREVHRRVQALPRRARLRSRAARNGAARRDRGDGFDRHAGRRARRDPARPGLLRGREAPAGQVPRRALRARGRWLARKRRADDPRRDETGAGHVHARVRRARRRS